MATSNLIKVWGPSRITTVRAFASSSARPFWRQWEYLDERAFSPNQLKWKQLVNNLVGSSRSDSRLVDSMDVCDLLRICEKFSYAHCQVRRHDIFLTVANRLDQLPRMGCHEMIMFLRYYMGAALDVLDKASVRHRNKQIQNCIVANYGLVGRLFSEVQTENLPDDDILSLLYITGIAGSKGWIDGKLSAVAPIADKAVKCLSRCESSFSSKCEALWAISRLIKLDVLDINKVNLNHLQRVVSPVDLVPFRKAENLTYVEFAPSSSFHSLLQLEETLETLGFSHSMVGRELAALLESVSTEIQDPYIASDLIWWCAVSEADIHPYLANWMTAASSGLPENERWRSVNGAAHILDIAKRRGSVPNDQRLKLEYLVTKFHS